MNYTLDKGVNDRPERIRSYALRGLPIVIASMVAIVGAYTQANNGSAELNNQEPLAIYTEQASDFGTPTNPQGNSSAPGDNQAGSTDTTGDPKGQPRLTTAQQSSGSSTASGGSSPSGTLSSLPVGGSGGSSGGCLCQQVQGAATSTVSTATGALPPVAPIPTLP